MLLFANVCLGMYYSLSIWFKLSDKTSYGAYISAIGAAITLISNYLLIPILGYMGCAIATVLCYGSMTVLCYILGQRYYYIPYRIRAVLLHLGIGIALVIIGSYLSDFEDFWLNIFTKNALLLLCLMLVIWWEKKMLQSRKWE